MPPNGVRSLLYGWAMLEWGVRCGCGVPISTTQRHGCDAEAHYYATDTGKLIGPWVDIYTWRAL